jgi:hypothetical protein
MNQKASVAKLGLATTVLCFFIGICYGVPYAPFCWHCLSSDVKQDKIYYHCGNYVVGLRDGFWVCQKCHQVWPAFRGVILQAAVKRAIEKIELANHSTE